MPTLWGSILSGQSSHLEKESNHTKACFGWCICKVCVKLCLKLFAIHPFGQFHVGVILVTHFGSELLFSSSHLGLECSVMGIDYLLYLPIELRAQGLSLSLGQAQLMKVILPEVRPLRGVLVLTIELILAGFRWSA